MKYQIAEGQKWVDLKYFPGDGPQGSLNAGVIKFENEALKIKIVQKIGGL